MVESNAVYLEKAVESLAGAESEYVNRRYGNCANRCYYACFQAAAHALFQAGFTPPGSRPTWSHEHLQAVFARELINRRKLFPGELRAVLSRTYLLRETADYTRDVVSEVQAARVLRQSRTFVGAIEAGGDRVS